MPTLTRWFIKLGMVYLLIGMAIGGAMLLQPLMGWSSALQTLRPVYLHAIFIGWVTQLIMGVGYWMFPKYSKATPRGSERLGWAVFVLLNVGLLLRSISEPLALLQPQQRGWGILLALAAVCLFLAGWGFVLNSWQRIRER